MELQLVSNFINGRFLLSIHGINPEEVIYSSQMSFMYFDEYMNMLNILRETMVLQGTSGEDMVSQIYSEVSKRVSEGKMEPDFYIDLIEAIADCDFRIREGANPRIQLEALLTKFI